MGTCSLCGRSGLFLKTRECFVCGNRFCYSCSPISVLTIAAEAKNEIRSEELYICPKSDCMSKLESCIDDNWNKLIGTDMNNFERAHTFFDNRILWFVREKYPKIFRNLAHKLHTSEPNYWLVLPKNSFLRKRKADFVHKCRNILAKNLVQTGRPLDAAIIYEKLQEYEKARVLRENEKRLVIKKTDVSLNLNALLKQIKEGGILAVYRCPHCGGKLKIEAKTTVNSLRHCEHCGSEIESMEIADFLKTVLS